MRYFRCKLCSIKTPHVCQYDEETKKIEFKGWLVDGELIQKLPTNIPFEYDKLWSPKK